jgi:hypothetical protein
LRAISVLLVNVVLVNNILRNRPGGSLTIATQQLLQNFTDLIFRFQESLASFFFLILSFPFLREKVM